MLELFFIIREGLGSIRERGEAEGADADVLKGEIFLLGIRFIKFIANFGNFSDLE